MVDRPLGHLGSLAMPFGVPHHACRSDGGPRRAQKDSMNACERASGTTVLGAQPFSLELLHSSVNLI